MRLIALLLLILAAGAARADGAPCGREAPCEIDGGSYHLMFPPDWDGATPMPALVFYHGFRSSGATVFRSGALKRDFAGQGYLVIAPNGLDSGYGRRWPGTATTGGRDDVAFTLAVLEDARRRAPLADRIYVSGFSAGGSMAWLLACREARRFAGFAPVAGALRRPAPERCEGGPMRLLQIHGYADGQVPLEGRGIRDWHQGDLFEALARARRINGCRSNPDAIEIGEPFWTRSWTGCEKGALALSLHPGGHGLPKGWAAHAREWLEAGGQGE